MNKKSLLIFDWDGTLMDSLNLIVTSIQDAAERLAWPQPDPNHVKTLIGLGLPEAIQQAFPEFSNMQQKDIELFTEQYTEIYVRRSATDQTLYPGVQILLADLVARGFILAVATGKSRRGLDRVLKESATEKYFTLSRCADETESKPSPKMLHEILLESKIEAQRALMIGDTLFDLQMANSANIESVGVSYGAHSADSLKTAKPLFLADSIENLGDWLNDFESSEAVI